MKKNRKVLILICSITFLFVLAGGVYVYNIVGSDSIFTYIAIIGFSIISCVIFIITYLKFNKLIKNNFQNKQ